MKIQLFEQEIKPWQEIEIYQQQLAHLNGKYGAISVFVGVMRDFNQDDSVESMYLEHYPGMTEKQLHKIVERAEQQWSLLDTLILHRFGKLLPDDTIVVVANWAAHRGDAIDACRFIIEELKHHAPFWKKEILNSGQQRWLDKNSCGYQLK
jgi:molybdopterin synthase catalytic subunit